MENSSSMKRTASAMANAANMDTLYNGFYMYIEGESDLKFWKKFVDRHSVRIKVSNGKETVIDTLLTLKSRGLKNYLGIIDRDFQDLLAIETNIDNLFLSDCHDIEMDIYNSNAISNVLPILDQADKITKFEEQNHKRIIQTVFGITNKIGHLKLADKLNNIYLSYADKDKNIKPKYEDLINSKCEIDDTSHLVDIVYTFSRSKNITPKYSKLEIVKFVKNIEVNEYDTFQLSNGHDVTYILYLVLKKKLNINIDILNHSKDIYISDLLLASYDWKYFRQTNLCQSLINWSINNQLSLFFNDLE